MRHLTIACHPARKPVGTIVPTGTVSLFGTMVPNDGECRSPFGLHPPGVCILLTTKMTTRIIRAEFGDLYVHRPPGCCSTAPGVAVCVAARQSLTTVRLWTILWLFEAAKKLINRGFIPDSSAETVGRMAGKQASVFAGSPANLLSHSF